MNGDALLDRYARALLPVFGRPQLVLSHGAGCHVWDVDGNRYLDLYAGLAVNALGHAHPRLVQVIADQAARAIHVSNFYTTTPQIELAERLLAVAEAPSGSAVFFANSGTEAVEAAIKVSRRTGRHRILAVEGSFHGRSTGALALTHKPQFREPFAPLLPGVDHLPLNDTVALKAAFADDPDGIAAVVLEPILGESGVLPLDPGYLQVAREVTRAHDALLILDEIQTGVGRTGKWFAFQHSDVRPDLMTLAKGLGGGVPIGALVTMSSQVTALLGAGAHGSTFGGNPLACAAGLAVVDAIDEEGLLENATRVGDHLVRQIADLRHPLISGTRGAGLLRAIALTQPVAGDLAAAALEAGFLVNAPNPHTLRLAPPLLIGEDEIDTFVNALPELLAVAGTPERLPDGQPSDQEAHP